MVLMAVKVLAGGLIIQTRMDEATHKRDINQEHDLRCCHQALRQRRRHFQAKLRQNVNDAQSWMKLGNIHSTIAFQHYLM